MILRRVVSIGVLIALAASLAVAADHAMLPDSRLTPGAASPAVTQATLKATICKPGYTATVRHVTAGMKRQVMQHYGFPASDLKLVEIDHFISLEIGGTNAIENLWPEYYEPAPGQTGYLGARQKDVIETSLHRAVCAGKIPLAEAQEAIRSWPERYRSMKGK